MEVPHEIWLQLDQWFQRRYLNTHTHTHTHTHNTHTQTHTEKKNQPCHPPQKYSALPSKPSHPIFFHLEQLSACTVYLLPKAPWWVYVCMYVYVRLGRLAFVKMYYNFLQVVVLLKNAVLWISFVQMGSFGMKKKKKKELMNKQNLCSHKKLSLGEYTVLNLAKTPAISPGYFSRKLKPRHIFGTAGTHRRLNPGT